MRAKAVHLHIPVCVYCCSGGGGEKSSEVYLWTRERDEDRRDTTAARELQPIARVQDYEISRRLGRSDARLALHQRRPPFPSSLLSPPALSSQFSQLWLLLLRYRYTGWG